MSKDLIDGLVDEMIQLLDGMTTVKAIRARNKVNLEALKKYQQESKLQKPDPVVNRILPGSYSMPPPQERERKDYFHTECFEKCTLREHEAGYNVSDIGSPEIIANLTGRCKECGGVIYPGHKIICRKAQFQEKV